MAKLKTAEQTILKYKMDIKKEMDTIMNEH